MQYGYMLSPMHRHECNTPYYLTDWFRAVNIRYRS